MKKQVTANALWLLLLAGLCTAIEANLTALPAGGSFEAAVEWNHTTAVMNVSYGKMLFGPAEVSLSAPGSTFNISYHLDENLSAGSFLTWYAMSGANQSINRTVEVDVINDVSFGLSRETKYCFEGSPCEFLLSAPHGTGIFVRVSGPAGPGRQAQPGIFSFVPKEGSHSITAAFSYRGYAQNHTQNFTVYQRLSCSIECDRNAFVNETVRFSANALGGIGKYSYSWNFGDGKKADGNSVTHSYEAQGTYEAVFGVRDSRGNEAECKRAVVVSPVLYSLRVAVIDSITGKALGDANVTVDSLTRKSNLEGIAKFRLEPGLYRVAVKRQGYSDYESTVRVSNGTQLGVNLTELGPEDLPLPEITLVSPQDMLSSKEGRHTFTWKAASTTRMYECMLLAASTDASGYRVLHTQESPAGNTQYTSEAELGAGTYRWSVQCENQYGISRAKDRVITLAPAAPAPREEPDVPALSEEMPDTGIFDTTIENIKAAQREILGYEGILAEISLAEQYPALMRTSLSEAEALRQDMTDLFGLKVSAEDRNRRKAEILDSLEKLRKRTPRAMRLESNREYYSVPEEEEVLDAAEDYLAWRNITLGSGMQRYLENLKEAQESLNAHTTAAVVKTEFVSGVSAEYSYILKEVNITEAEGAVYIELLPGMISSPEQASWSAPYQKISERTVSIYTSIHSSFVFRASGGDLDGIARGASVLILDPTHPKNRVTGYGIFSSGSGSGKLALVLLLVAVIAAGNYAIFLRQPESRQKLASYYRGLYKKAKPKNSGERLTGLLSEILDHLAEKREQQAFSLFPQALSFYETSEPALKKDVLPILTHLHHELELHNANKVIEESYSMVVHGRWYEVIRRFEEAKSALSELPDSFGPRVSRRFGDVALALEIHRMKSHVAPETSEPVDSLLFRVKK